MVDWYLNRALSNFRNAVNARWPLRDKTSDGTIGDAAHQATSSDHNPDADGSVDAWDMDVDGVDVWACIRAALAHESIQYVIYNRKITSRSWGLGTWRTYDGSNPHDKHVHFNTRSSYENSAAPWLLREDDDMTTGERWVLHVMNYRLDAIRSCRATIRVPARLDLGPQYVAYEESNNLAAAVGRDMTDEPAIIAGVLAGLSPEAIVAAIPPTVAGQVADILAARLQS